MGGWKTLVETAPAPRFAAAAAGGVVLPAIVAVVADGALAIGGGIGAGIAAILVVAAVAWRRQAAQLPLSVASVAARSRYDGHPAYLFRVRLGNGRTVRSAKASIRFVPASGEPIDLEIIEAEGARIGAWTVLAVDRGGRCAEAGEGSFRFSIEAIERGRVWNTQAAISTITEGRFRALLQKDGSWSDRWDQIEEGVIS